ncbi:segregation/condensation protein A [Nanoarchaeota archaeon]
MKQDQIMNLILEEDDVSWKTILFDLVKTEQINPWDVDISFLTNKYLDIIKKMKQLDLRISGKVLLAAAYLLKLKSIRLLGHDIDELDRLFARTSEADSEESFFSEFSDDLFNAHSKLDQEEPQLIPRTPQPRQRKISIYDLADALQKAMEVKKRKVIRGYPEELMEIPKKKVDISQIIRDVYTTIKTFFFKNKNQRLTFSQLLPSDSKEDKVYTFIPLLHLDNQRKIDLWQKQHFGEIEVELYKARKKVEQEIE